MAKIDPLLKYLTRAGVLVKRAQIESLGGAPAAPANLVNIMIEVTDGVVPPEVTSVGFVPRTRAGNVITGHIPSDAIGLLEDVAQLKRAERARPLLGELDVALPDARVLPLHQGTPSRRGAGVIVGVIDSGIDYQHQAFRDAHGTSRILAIWDQGLTPQRGESSPQDFDYGVEYSKSTIDAALQSSVPLTLVRHQDVAGHGTFVAGIAAGGGVPEDSGRASCVGVAPDADLIVVANTRGRASDPGSLSDSADTLDAVAYILSTAARLGKPVVINLSQGDNIGPHDGTSLLEVGLANLIEGPGRVLIKSAGNGGAERRHAAGDLLSSEAQEVRIIVAARQREVVVDFWYAAPGRITISVMPPSGTASRRFASQGSDVQQLSNLNRVFVDADLDDPGNRQNRIFVALAAGELPALEPGVWTFRLEGHGQWDGWIQLTSHAEFAAPFATTASSISIPASSRSVISVGAYISDDSYSFGSRGELSAVSSHGPTRDGRQAPTLCAPGEEIMAPARGHGNGSRGHVARCEGTSMAAAMVTGAAALMLEIRPSSTASEIRLCLEQTARLDAQTGATPTNAWGAGKLDVEAACRRVASLPQ